MLLAALSVVGLGAVAPATAAPGSPGVPGAPVPVFTETFENNTGAAAVRLQDYVGAGPLAPTYTAEAQWLPAGGTCNGIILTEATPTNDPVTCDANAYTRLHELAVALGTVNGTTPPGANHVVSAYTQNQPGANRIQFRTVSPIPLPASNQRFITFGVNAAAINCTFSGPQLRFFLADPDAGGTEVPVTNTPINPCPPGQTAGAGAYASDGNVLFTGSRVHVIMRNANGSGTGNDAAFDDVKILDVTPQLDQDYGPTSIGPGGTTTLTYTITNTDERGQKAGWSFSGTLPPGTSVVGTPTTTCAAGTVPTVVGSVVSVPSGTLAAGDASCTVTVQVTATTVGTYSNPVAGVSTTGLNPPAATSFQVVEPAVVIDDPTPGTTIGVGDREPGSFTCSGGAAPLDCTAEVELPDGSTVPLADGADVPSAVPGTYTITATVVDANGTRRTTTRTYEVVPLPEVVIDSPTPGTSVPVGTAVPGAFTCSSGVAPLTCTGQVTRPDGSTVPLASGGDLPTDVPGVYTITAKVVDARGVERTTTRTYVVVAILLPPPVGVPPVAPGPVPVAPVPASPSPAPGRLAVGKRVSRTLLRPGQRTTVTVSVTNRGGTTLRNVKLCEQIPAGLRFVSGTPRPKLEGGRRCWTVGTLRPGQTARRAYVARAVNRPGPVRLRTTGQATDVRSGSAVAGVTIRRAAPDRSGGVTG